MDFEIRNLAEALSFEVDDTVQLERFVENNRRLRNQLASQPESLAYLTANFKGSGRPTTGSEFA